jgi:type I restriction enzyme S subunit
MSRIDRLIAELCPGGVEFSRVGDIATVGTGNSDRKDATPDGKFPFYVRSKDILRIDTYEFDEEAILIPGEGGIGEIFHYVSGRYALHQRAYRISITLTQLDTKFAYYYFAVHFKSFILSKAVSATVTSIRKPMITEFRIPIPPLEVQREIVKVLDTFTQQEAVLEAELEAELEARRRQYKYYRDALFSFSDGEVRRVAMAEVGEFFRGRRFTKNDLASEGVACIHYGDIYTQYGTASTTTVSHVRVDMASKLRFAQSGDLVIAGVGETVEDVGKAVAWLGEGEVAIHDDCFAFRHSLNPKFVSYYFQTTAFHTEKNKFVARAKVKRLSGESLGKLTIPVPPPEEQERIVVMLDRFDALVNDLSNSLPVEIKARRLQYEHYRDRLLSFREAA